MHWDYSRSLVESIVDYAIFMLDLDGLVMFWNRGAEKMYGYTAKEIVGCHFRQFFLPEDSQVGTPEGELVRARQSGRAENEGWRVRKDGSRFWANTVVSPVYDEQGSLRGFGKVTRDLTERARAEEGLRRSEQRFHHLIDAVTDYAIFMLDLDGNVASWNPGAQRIKGYEESEILGQHFSIFYPKEDREAQVPQSILARARDAGRFEAEGFRVRKDGSKFWANVIITALRDSAGVLAGYAKVTRDLTAQRRVQEELRHSEERFRFLVESVTDYAIYMLDLNGRVTTWNAGAQRLKGYSASEIIGRSFAVFFTQEDLQRDRPAQELAIALREGRFEDEGWRVRKDGARFWAGVVINAIRDGAGNLRGFAKITRDLTERHQAQATELKLIEERAARTAAERAEQRLRESEERARLAADAAEHANRAKDEFLALVSHELRTPLNAIVGWAAMLRTRSLEAGTQKAVEVIHRNALAQVKLVDDILDVSRITTGKLRLETRPTDFSGVTRDALEAIRPSADAKQITLEADTVDTLKLVGDPERLQQVVWNLLSNAVKFTPAKGTVRVTLRPEGKNVVLEVSDTGKGISPDFLSAVFERFKQADSSTTRRHGGLGLGLALVRHIVELHGGSVSAHSAGEGKGATFRVVLPAASTVPAIREHAPNATGSASPVRAPSTLRGVRILVVDDESDARELVLQVLLDAGFLVRDASNAREAMRLVADYQPQVLVCDIGMPNDDGYSLLRAIRESEDSRFNKVPAIALTAYSTAADHAKALAAGFAVHLSKPATPETLLKAISSVFESEHARSVQVP